MIILGIDPGIKGGVAWCWDNGESVKSHPMPATRKQLYQLLRDNLAGAKLKAVVESVHSMPKQGVASTFKFGKGYGEVLGILTALGAEIIEPTPQAWKKVVLAGTDKSKDAAIQVAENLYPEINLVPKGCRKPHDGMADAVCLMHYGRTLP
ncbi:Holliday junction endonuclease [Oryzomonas sagensis]|uniref:Holliday junction endonuclease n=1 Tax=Oryzomonas sagensis TaxID=2603857 RepID=A0ABQ6TL14_9BACT|nr:Holliday junction endonuclease [Oryzomonas sagensis]KAB0668962.1 Holliday junction endonuclease [Oryzomonas sagensis]